MSRKPNPKPTDPEQSKKFLETAKALEVDKTGKSFISALNTIAPKKKRTDSEPEKGEGP